MSRDQKPGRIRVIAGAQAPDHPMRRAGDLAPATAPTSEPAVLETSSKRGPGLLTALLFLVGCAVGGAGFAVIATAF